MTALQCTFEFTTIAIQIKLNTKLITAAYLTLRIRNGRLKQHFNGMPTIHGVKALFYHTTFHHQKKAVESFIIQLAVLELPTKQLPN